ncbi:MAG: hypothetical protein AB1451_15705 [Nitrospirota bacterium]
MFRRTSTAVKYALGGLVAMGGIALLSLAPVDQARAGSEITIHLVQKNGFFESKDSMYPLKAGEYAFEVANDTGRDVGFQLQDPKTGKTLILGPLKIGETKTFKAKLAAGDYRYRCPINPTPWYDFSVDKG